MSGGTMGLRRAMEGLQPLGRALMLPIAVLPVAGLLLRLGQGDLLGLDFVSSAGNAIFAHLGLLFAIGVAVGLARENHGAAGLAGAVAFLVTTEGAKALLAPPAGLVPPGVVVDAATKATLLAAWCSAQVARMAVPAGIASGVIGGLLYNRFHAIRMPDYLAFFGGRRFVPIAAGGLGLVLAVVLGLGYPALALGIDALSHWVARAGWLGLFLYGTLNRLLLVTGLHHILNNLVWFVLGDYHGATGDLNRFFAGDPTAGSFMSGFFPVMMFGLPAACLAMYRTALPEKRAEVGGLFLSLAATSFLTGVTEPIEFTFMFLAPALYAVHAVLTGLGMVVMQALGVHLGFGFSAGLFDYLINYRIATRPLLLLPVGAAYFAAYFLVFRACILRFDLATPGRRVEAALPEDPAAPTGAQSVPHAYVAALGGADNLATIDACTTRLRLMVADPARVDEAALRRLGARGVVRPGGGAVQVVVGPIADTLASQIRQSLSGARPLPAAPPPMEPASANAAEVDITALVAACGGLANLASAQGRGSRLLLALHDRARADHAALSALAPRGVVVGEGHVHLLTSGDAQGVARQLAAVLARAGVLA